MTLPPAPDEDFPVTLKKLRLAKGYTYAKLAEIVGVHQNMPSRYENPKHGSFTRPSFDTWQKLNEALCDPALDSVVAPTLSSATVEELIAELKKRGASSVSLQW